MCDSSNGQWRMSKEYPVDGVVTAHSGHQLVHLSWSHHGNELAIIDAFGQISIYSVFIAINRLSLYRRCVPDPEDHLSAVIGMTWLHLDRIVWLPSICNVGPMKSVDSGAVLFPQGHAPSQKPMELHRISTKTARAP